MWSWGFRSEIRIFFLSFYVYQSYSNIGFRLLISQPCRILYIGGGSCWSSWLNKIYFADHSVGVLFWILNCWWIGEAIFESHLLNLLDALQDCWKREVCFLSIVLMTVRGKLQTVSVLQYFLAVFIPAAEANFFLSFLWHINAVPGLSSWLFTSNYIHCAQHHEDQMCFLHVSFSTVIPATVFWSRNILFHRRDMKLKLM